MCNFDCDQVCGAVEINGVCQCAGGRICPDDPCANATCAGFPGATCSRNQCGKCTADWFVGDTFVDCSDLGACSSDQDCGNNQLCRRCGDRPGECVATFIKGQVCDQTCPQCNSETTCQRRLTDPWKPSTDSVCCPEIRTCSCPQGQRPKFDNDGCRVCTSTSCLACECEPVPCALEPFVGLNNVPFSCSQCPVIV